MDAAAGAQARWRADSSLPCVPVPSLADLLARGSRADEALWLRRCIALAAGAAAAHDRDSAGAVPGDGPEHLPRVAAMQMHHHARTLAVAAADVARGYVDVPAGTRFSVATTGDGYVVDVVPRLALFSAVEIRLGALRAYLGADGGTLVARGRPRRDAGAEIHYRFRLAGGVAPGVYPFPLDLVVRPLQGSSA